MVPGQGCGQYSASCGQCALRRCLASPTGINRHLKRDPRCVAVWHAWMSYKAWTFIGSWKISSDMCTISGDTFTIQKESLRTERLPLWGRAPSAFQRCVSVARAWCFLCKSTFSKGGGLCLRTTLERRAARLSSVLNQRLTMCRAPSICEATMLWLMQEKRRREMALQNLQMAVTAGLPHLGVPQLGLPAPAPGAVRPPLQASSNMLMEGFPQNLLQSGAHMGLSLYESVSIAPQSWHGTFCMQIHK